MSRPLGCEPPETRPSVTSAAWLPSRMIDAVVALTEGGCCPAGRWRGNRPVVQPVPTEGSALAAKAAQAVVEADVEVELALLEVAPPALRSLSSRPKSPEDEPAQPVPGSGGTMLSTVKLPTLPSGV